MEGISGEITGHFPEVEGTSGEITPRWRELAAKLPKEGIRWLAGGGNQRRNYPEVEGISGEIRGVEGTSGEMPRNPLKNQRFHNLFIFIYFQIPLPPFFQNRFLSTYSRLAPLVQSLSFRSLRELHDGENQQFDPRKARNDYNLRPLYHSAVPAGTCDARL